MGIGEFFKKIGGEISKKIKASQINAEWDEELKNLKAKYLSQLSHKELVQIYKTVLEE